MHKCIPNYGAKIIHIASTLLRDAEKDQTSANHADQLGQTSDDFFVSCVDGIFEKKAADNDKAENKKNLPKWA